MTKIGKVKFRDRTKRYGYIISEDAAGPRETVLFDAEDASSAFDVLTPGSSVRFEIDLDEPGRHAKNVTLI